MSVDNATNMTNPTSPTEKIETLPIPGSSGGSGLPFEIVYLPYGPQKTGQLPVKRAYTRDLSSGVCEPSTATELRVWEHVQCLHQQVESLKNALSAAAKKR